MEPPRTRLEQLFNAAAYTIGEQRAAYHRTARECDEPAEVSYRQLSRWLAGDVDVEQVRAANKRVALRHWGEPFEVLVGPPRYEQAAADEEHQAPEPDEAPSPDSAVDASLWDANIVRWLLPRPGPARDLAGAGRLTKADVEALLEMTDTFSRLDMRFGGGHARTALEQYLADDVTPRLRCASTETGLGRDYFSAAAVLTFLAAWMAYDTGLHAVAARHMRSGLALAEAAQDVRYGARVLCGMSHQANYLGHYAAAEDLAKAARMRGATTPTGMALYFCMEARALASQGEERACTAALRSAEAAFARHDPGDEPAWLFFFDEAELAAEFAHCFLALGKAQQAQRYVEASTAVAEQLHVRSLTFVRTVLAASLVEQGQLDHGLAVARDVVSTAADLHSMRVRGYVAHFMQRLAPWQSSPAVSEFEQLARGQLLDAAGRRSA